MRWRGEVRLSKVNTALLVFGLALLIAAAAGPRVNIDGSSVGPGVSWWQRVLVLAVGVLVAGWGVLASRELVPVLGADRGFVGAPPRLPTRLVQRPDLLAAVVRALRPQNGVVAFIGIGGAGKSTLAAEACAHRRVRRAFPDGITWLEAGPGQDPMALVADLARRVGQQEAAASFATVGEGLDVLAAALRGKRMLVAVDNVWERGPLDALIRLPDTCTVMFTSRLPALAITVSATQIPVDKLTQDQALELLSRWTESAAAESPQTARALCARVGNLALGVAMVGAMIARDRSFTDVLELIELDLARVETDLDPAYPYRTLFAAIEAGISDLPPGSQERYAQLVVFAGLGPFPRAAAEALWRPGLSDAEAGDLLAELTSRSLLTSAGEDWYVAHDLQYEVLARRLTAAELAAAHARLLAGYRNRYRGGWADAAADPYLGRALASHLRAADLNGELRAVLTDTTWIQARLTHGQMPDLIPDYSHAEDPVARQILRALRRSAAILAADPTQVRGQLAGRLIGHPDPGIDAWARDLASHHGLGTWLAPLTPALTPTTDPLQQILTDHIGAELSVAIAADGGTAISGNEYGKVRVWDLTTGQPQATLTGHSGAVRSVAITPDGGTAISGDADGTVRVWDLTVSQGRATLTGHTGAVTSVAVTADGSTAISGGADGTIRVWDLTTSQPRATLTSHTRAILSMAVTPDGSTAISGSDDGTMRVWDLTTSQPHATLTSRTGWVYSVAVTADGSTAISGSDDGTIQVWDLTTSQPRATLTGHTGAILSLAIAADGSTAISGGGTIQVWDLTTSQLQATLTGHTRAVRSVAITPDGSTAISGGGTIQVWDLTTVQPQATILTGHTSAVRSVAITPDGGAAISASWETTVRVWDLVTSQQRATLTGHTSAVGAVAITADGCTAISGSNDGTMRVWDLVTGEQQATLTNHISAVRSVAITPDGSTAISGSSDGTIQVWDLVSGEQQATLTGHTGAVLSLAITPDGSTAISSDDHGTIQIWDLITGQLQATATGYSGSVTSVAITPDGSTAISGSNTTIQIWDLVAGEQQAAFIGHTSAVRSVAITPDGSIAISGGDDQTVRVWDLTTGAQLARWVGDSRVVGCTTLQGEPLRIGVGQEKGLPYLLELHDQQAT